MEEHNSVYRILDASFNRASEGLRTLEEAGRFALNHSELASEFKELRHGLASSMEALPRAELIRSRDTTSDVGTEIQAGSEYRRQSIESVVIAAASRVQQSMRVLEEYMKVIDAEPARKLERIRYRIYTACANLELKVRSNQIQQRLADSHLYLLLDAADSDLEFERRMTDLIDSGVDIVQLRDRSVSDRTLLRRARIGVRIARDAGKLFIVNDRADLALAADADGVHVGQEELPAIDARRILGSDRIIGVSTHSLEEAKQAVADGADYIGCGPVFPSHTKAFKHFVGVDMLREVAAMIQIPSFAIGGIDSSKLEQIIDSGFYRVAVSNAVHAAPHPMKTANEIKQVLEEAASRLSPTSKVV